MATSGMSFDKLIGIILLITFAYQLLVSALVPQLSGWATAVSDIGGVDYGWGVYLTFLVIMFAIIYSAVKSGGIKGV